MSQTIADGLSHIINAKTNIDNTITAKGGVVSKGLINTPTDIATIPSGGGGGSAQGTVRFLDYDGTLVTSYTPEEFAALEALPDNPTHEGLTSQGWNWSLADAKEYVADYGKLDVGQMYITSDSKTRLYINLLDDYKSPTLELYLNANSEVDVDWGDGSSHSTLSSTSAWYQSETHSYPASGDYIIAITVVSGSIEIRGNNTSFSLLKGNDSTTNTNYRESLFNIEIPPSVTSIGDSAFNNCSSLTSITIPPSVTSIGDSAFNNCSSLTSITIPPSVTSIGDSAFRYCYSLSSITIPDSVTSIGNYAFSSCSSLSSVTIPDGVISIGSSAFQQCYSLSSITIPDTVAIIGGGAFSNCSSLFSVTIPPSVTSIGYDAFRYCYHLTKITIPDVVSGSFFDGCHSLKYIYLLGTHRSDAPWGAPNTHIKIITLSRHNNYSDVENETQSGTELTTTINCNTNDLIIAAFVVRSSYTIPPDWNILTISDAIEASGTYQWTGILYKVAAETAETITISQSNAGRIYTTLIAIPSASIGTYSSFGQASPDTSITINKPSGLNILVCSCILGEPNWSSDDAVTVLTSSTKRLGVLLDQTKVEKSTTISRVNQQNAGLIATYLTITGIDNFWYYDEPT